MDDDEVDDADAGPTLCTLTEAIAATSREGLGPDATSNDLEAYVEALTRAWPAGKSLYDEDVYELTTAVLEGRAGRDEHGRSWVEVGHAQSVKDIVGTVQEIADEEGDPAISDTVTERHLRLRVERILGYFFDAEAWDDAIAELRAMYPTPPPGGFGGRR